MRGIEAAFFGTLGRDPERKISKSGNVFAAMNVAVTVGQTEESSVTQWVRVVCFSETAERIAATCKKQDRVYVEGSLTMGSWATSEGEHRTGLNVAAFKVEKLGAIGRNRPSVNAGEILQRLAGVKVQQGCNQ